MPKWCPYITEQTVCGGDGVKDMLNGDVCRQCSHREGFTRGEREEKLWDKSRMVLCPLEIPGERRRRAASLRIPRWCTYETEHMVCQTEEDVL